MITLIGHGYIGTHIAKTLTNFEWISHKETPNRNTSFIINATGFIGFPNADQCEVEKNTCIDANVVFPLKLERENKVPIIHITSGCVYSGYPDGGYSEDDKPNFGFEEGSFYGGCKSLMQTLIEPYLEKSYVFRIRLPFDDTTHFRNLLNKYERFEKLIDVENSITCIEDLQKCVNFFIKERPQFGMYNVVNKNTTTTKSIVDKMNIKKDWMTMEEYKTLSKSPRSNCSLSTKKIKSVYNMPDINEALNKTIYNYRKTNS